MPKVATGFFENRAVRFCVLLLTTTLWISAIERAKLITRLNTPGTQHLSDRLAATTRSAGASSEVGCAVFKSSETRKDQLDVIAFTHTGGMLDRQLIALVLARYFNPASSILVLTNNASMRSNALIKKLNVCVILHSDNDVRLVQLKKTYRHSSSNSEEFEIYCLRRFLLLDGFISTLPDTWSVNIWHLDLDIMIFSTLVKVFPHLHVWTLTQTSSFFALFSRQSLHAFSEFIIDVYQKSAFELAYFIDRYGTASRDVKTDRLPWWPKGTQLIAKQFSDMHIFGAWTDSMVSANTLRAPTFFTWKPNTHPFPVPVACTSTDLANITWYEERGTPGFYGFPSTMKFPMFLGQLGTLEPVLGLHFQGACKRHICETICPLLYTDDVALLTNGCCVL